MQNASSKIKRENLQKLRTKSEEQVNSQQTKMREKKCEIFLSRFSLRRNTVEKL